MTAISTRSADVPLRAAAVALAGGDRVPQRPVLSRAARRLWRDPGTLQLGRPPGPAVVLSGIDAGVRAVLSLLDGTRDRDQLRRDAAAAGCPPARTTQLLDLLAGCGLLEDAGDSWPGEEVSLLERDRMVPDVRSLALIDGGSGLASLGRRAAACVLVLGAGRVGAPLAGLLGASGVGTVDVQDEQEARPRDAGPGGTGLTDMGRARGGVARDALRQQAPTALGAVPTPDLVVLAPCQDEEDGTASALTLAGVPHLLAAVRGPVGVVGPLVLPGVSACLQCLDLTRTDRDPAWPVMAAQLSSPRREVEPCDSSLAVAVAAHAALQVLARLDGRTPATLGGTLELTLPDWRWRRRSWPLHPDCGCSWRATG